jgi:2-aminobenzoate-CoA ligase
VLLMEGATPPVLAELVDEHGVTVLFTAPTAYRAIVQSGRIQMLSGLRRAVSAGEHMPRATWEALRDGIDLEVLDGIGATELLHIFISTRVGRAQPGSTGTPVPGYRATILDEDGNDQPAGEPGRLAVVGPTGCRYLDDPRQRDYVSGGWNLTGDTFVRDEDGQFHFVGRNDAMIVSSGYNIAGPEVEEALMQHDAVAECAVVGRPDATRGAVVCAFVVPVEGVEADARLAADIQDFVKRTIAPYKYPRDVRFLSGLPRNASGKVQHFRLRKELAEAADDTDTP